MTMPFSGMGNGLNATATGLGMPAGRKPTRRGGRRKGPGGDPHVHLGNAKTALGAGDHAAARSHGFAFIRSLDKLGQTTGTGQASAQAKAAPQAAAAPTAVPTVQTPAAGFNPARLMGALKGFGGSRG